MKALKLIISFLVICFLHSNAQMALTDPFIAEVTNIEEEKDISLIPNFKSFTKESKDKVFSLSTIESSDLKSLTETRTLMYIIDLRDNEAFDISHISGSKLISHTTFNKDQVSELNKNTTIILYDNLLNDETKQVAAYMQYMGFIDIRILNEGLIGWANNNYPMVDREGKASKSVVVNDRNEAKELKKTKATATIIVYK